MATDRAIIKERQSGQAGAYGLASSGTAAIAETHMRSRDIPKLGTENAATNVAETVLFTVVRKGQLKAFYYLTNSTIAGNATDYVYVTVSKRTAGGTAALVASWNSHTSAESTITALVPASFPLVANSNATIAAGDVLTYTVRKVAAGKLLDVPSTFTVDLEEV